MTTPFYRPSFLQHNAVTQEYRLFTAKILTVDYERFVCTLQDINTGLTVDEVSVFPANGGGTNGVDVNMPEPGGVCLACNLFYHNGYTIVAIVAYIASGEKPNLDSIAFRLIDGVEGWSTRTRGNYRKAYPGQKTSVLREGYTEKKAEGWDFCASDLSRDWVDPDRRQRVQTTGKAVSYSDAGLHVSGYTSRLNASVQPTPLPNGELEYVIRLKPDSSPTGRYTNGEPDALPYAESRTLIQEFALDYPVPAEVLGTDLLETVLGQNADAWARTTIEETGNVQHDANTMLIDQPWDHPYQSASKTVGPTTSEGLTPQRKGFIVEHVAGTLVGFHHFDPATYGKVLKPVLFPHSTIGRFATSVESGYVSANESPNHSEARLASVVYSTRFPYEYNTTRWDVTKEGMLSVEIGSTLPKENIPWQDGYEHPHGAGRSVEAHLTGSLKMVVGKNRDEEEAIDLTALGQTVLRLGADDTSLPNDRRHVMTQIRASSDAVMDRSVQFWKQSKLKPGDIGSLASKTGAANISLFGATDGGVVMRFGARNPSYKRRHLINGYQDGRGISAYGVGDPNRQDSKTDGRPVYGVGDAVYSFHDLTKSASPNLNMAPYNWSGSPVTNMDSHGQSIDFHTVRDVLLRCGANPDSGQSLLLDLAGGLVGWLGKDKQGRSITATLDGGVEMVIGQNNQKKGLRLEINGDLDWTVRGNFHLNCTGSTVISSMEHVHNVKTDYVVTAQRITEKALVRHVTEASEISHNQGLYFSGLE